MYNYKIFDEMSKLFDREFFGADTITKYSVPAFPPVRIVQRDNKVSFKFALAGYKKDDIQVSFEKDCLILSTTEKFKKESSEKKDSPKVLVDNLKTPVFSYKYFIPNDKFDFENVEAKFEDGILSISVPAKEKAIPEKKFIEIK